MYIVANQLELSNGVRRDRGDCLVDAEQVISPPVLQKRGTLYIITETENMSIGKPRSGDVELCREVQETILHDFYNTSNTSVTGALRHALEKANQLAFNYNSTLMPPERRGVGLTVALVRGNEVYSGQMLPTRAYLFHLGEIKTLPASALTGPQNRSTDQLQGRTRTGADDPQDTLPLPRHSSLPALGRYTSIEPILTRNIFEAGDKLVLCSSSYSRVLQDADLQSILDQPDSRGALANLSEFSRKQNINDGYALIIGTREEVGARPSADRQPDSGWKSTAEGMAGAVSLLAARLNPMGPRSNQRSEDDNYQQEDGAFVNEAASPIEARRDITRPLKQPPETNRHVEEAAELDPLAPLSNESMEAGSWLHREDDDLNRPAFLKGRSVEPDSPSIADSKEVITSPGPIRPKPFTSRLGGDGTITPFGPRKFSYTDASQEPGNTAPPGSSQPFSTRPYVQSYRAPVPEIPEVPVDFEEPVEVRKRWWGKRPVPESQGQVKGQPANSPYFDMVGGDGYGPPVQKKWAFNNLSVRNRSLIMAGVGLVMGLAVVLLILSVAGGTITGSKTKAAELVLAAETKRGNAQQMAESDPAAARNLLALAATDLDAARKARADLPEIQTSASAIKQTLNTVNKVTIPADLRVALDLTSQGTGVSLSRAVISAKGDQLYLMDSGQGRIYSADVLGAAKTILKGGDKAGNNSFGKPVAMVARPDGLLVLDDGNLAWSYNKTAGKWTAQTLGGAPKGNFQAASYLDNLYLIGTGTGQILKYNAGNYAAKPDEWVNPSLIPSLNLDKSSGFAIDGTVYSLTKEGHLYQMARPTGKDKGELVKEFDIFKDPRLGPAFNSPHLLNVGSLEYPYIFVLDGENRVLQFSKATGAFIQQFQSAEGNKEFNGLKDVAVDEANKKIYLVGSDKVYVYNLINAPVTPGSQTVPAGTPGATPANQTPGVAKNATIIATQTTPKS